LIPNIPFKSLFTGHKVEEAHRQGDLSTNVSTDGRNSSLEGGRIRSDSESMSIDLKPK